MNHHQKVNMHPSYPMQATEQKLTTYLVLGTHATWSKKMKQNLDQTEYIIMWIWLSIITNLFGIHNNCVELDFIGIHKSSK